MRALRAEAAACFADPVLVTVDFGKIEDADLQDASVVVERLKASARMCFLSAKLMLDGRVLFTAKAVFKTISGPVRSK